MKKITALFALFSLFFAFACGKPGAPAEEYKTALVTPQSSSYYNLDGAQAEQLIHQIIKNSLMRGAVKAFASYDVENQATQKYQDLKARESERKTVVEATDLSIKEMAQKREERFKEYDPFTAAQYFYDLVFITAYAMGMESFFISLDETPAEPAFDYSLFLTDVQQSAAQFALGQYADEQDRIRTTQFIAGYKLLMHEYDLQQEAIVDEVTGTTPQERAHAVYTKICAQNTCVK